ncbi:MAG: hypothetical protein K1X66_06280 [Verrucomicrobiae bacterium]|nr:hypothetical protein [Verrucomicrobiae bacterium]
MKTIGASEVNKNVLREESSESYLHSPEFQLIEQWRVAIKSLLLACVEEGNPYTSSLLACYSYMKVARWEKISPLQKLVVLSALRTIINNEIQLKETIEKQVDSMLFLQVYQELLQRVHTFYS